MKSVNGSQPPPILSLEYVSRSCQPHFKMYKMRRKWTPFPHRTTAYSVPTHFYPTYTTAYLLPTSYLPTAYYLVAQSIIDPHNLSHSHCLYLPPPPGNICPVCSTLSSSHFHNYSSPPGRLHSWPTRFRHKPCAPPAPLETRLKVVATFRRSMSLAVI